jgi:histidinol-phosphate aminotransferase
MVISQYAFAIYEIVGKLFQAKVVEAPARNHGHDLDAMRRAITPRTRLVFVANPNNPTGTMVGQAALDRFVDALPEHVVAVFDEAYHEYVDEPPDTLRYVREGRNVCVLRTFSKAHGLAGLRVGYGLAPAPLAAVLQKARQPFNVNAVGQAGAVAALGDHGHVEASRALNRAGMARLAAGFDARGIPWVPSHANFLLGRVGDGDGVFRAMLSEGVIVRAMRGYKLPEWIRVTIGTEAELDRFFRVLDKALSLVKC